ncbi:tetraacyldisaccharide 4'-kinase [Legionella fallonii]|uniref:Tetraacyldisaccharide 4'-kinase n=1 Tax=Legionella fallonii LLAP-10 TaxID=1212491 RepID=A0A098G5V6_9GAMM|nr:tetraacyldisaccharide 4'-kinase [Legionella fallonii]CEG57354.1 lipid A 4'kinase [Legionella fallonii LLAP-10]
MSLTIDKLWYGNHPLKWTLLPVSWGYRLIVGIRRWYLQNFCQVSCSVPLIVVGNLTVGGVGKTPLVIALAKKMQHQGLKVGIVSRGYGAKTKNYPHEIQLSDSAELVGDEPLLLARKTNCPVVISPVRTKAVDYLLEKHRVQIIISDDGLQHYRMGRAIEIAVIDGTRGLGNGLCLPAGPLRESESRLKQVDFVIVNGGTWGNAYRMSLVPGSLTKLSTQETISSSSLAGTIAAVAAIGNPQRFYSTLGQLGIEFTTYTYPDHYQFKSNDLNYAESFIIMTEKDAVKCFSFSSDKMYYLPVEAQLDDAFWQALWSHQQLKGYCYYAH